MEVVMQMPTRTSMYSKKLLRKYIDEGLHLKGWSELTLADKLGMAPSNLARAINAEGFNLTLPQFAQLVGLLDLTPDQVAHILTGKRVKDAKAQLLLAYARKIVDGL